MGRRVARKKCETGEGERTFFIIIFVATKNNKINIIEMIRLGKKKQRFERCRNMCTQVYIHCGITAGNFHTFKGTFKGSFSVKLLLLTDTDKRGFSVIHR